MRYSPFLQERRSVASRQNLRAVEADLVSGIFLSKPSNGESYGPHYWDVNTKPPEFDFGPLMWRWPYE